MADNANLSENFKVIDPFRGYQQGDEVTLTLYDTYMEITGKQEPITIQYNKVTNASHGQSQQEHKTENRSVIGGLVGNVAGELLFGQSGEMIGDTIGSLAGFASSGFHMDEYHHRLYFTYLNDQGDEVAIHLMDEKNRYGREIANELKKHVDIKVTRNLNV